MKMLNCYKTVKWILSALPFFFLSQIVKFSKLYSKRALRIPIRVRDTQENLATDIENSMSHPSRISLVWNVYSARLTRKHVGENRAGTGWDRVDGSLEQDSPIAAQNSLSQFSPAGNLDGDPVPHSHGAHKILNSGYLAPHQCVRSRTPAAYRELLRNDKNSRGSHL